MKTRITIGIPSIVLIFMILCLAVFSLLSLSDAKSALTYAQKHADTVQMYYEADAAAQKLLLDSDAPVSEIPMASGQTLYVETSEDDREILAYYVYNNTDYVIDSDLPVWEGN